MVVKSNTQLNIAIWQYTASTLQIIRGGKLSWYAGLICWKAFAIRHQSCKDKAYSTGYFIGKVLRLLIDLQKLRSTVNDLQYTVLQYVTRQYAIWCWPVLQHP